MSLLPENFYRIQKAASFAARHHLNQEREGRTPYIAHPFRVALTIRHLFEIDDPATLCAALLHDLIEKSGVNYDELQEEFGQDVADLVAAMSKDFRLPETLREAEFDECIRSGSWELRAIKLADAYDNLCDRKPGSVEKAERAVSAAESDYRLKIAVGALRDLIAVEALRESVNPGE